MSEVLERVNARFAERGEDLAGWADPHPGRDPLDEEYSRLVDPGKWRILVARADAWAAAMTAVEVARLAPVAADDVAWIEPPGPLLTSATWLIPAAEGALPLIIGRTRIGDVANAGLTLGIGDPAIGIGSFPSCGCDACDSGSQDELDRVDAAFTSVATGAFRRLARGSTTITAGTGGGAWASSPSGAQPLDQVEIEAALRDPTGWSEISGAPWI